MVSFFESSLKLVKEGLEIAFENGNRLADVCMPTTCSCRLASDTHLARRKSFSLEVWRVHLTCILNW
jgi:hypothetical protein